MLAALPAFRAASAVMRYVLVTKRIPAGWGLVLRGVILTARVLISTATVFLPPATNAPGRKPITIWPSSVKAENASLTPPVTGMSAWPGLGFWFAPACGGGQVKLYGAGGPKPS